MTWPDVVDLSVAASVLTPLGPMGQSELSMSMICLARTPCGVLMLIRTPDVAGIRGRRRGLQAQHVAPSGGPGMALQISAIARLSLRAWPGNVQHNLELEQRCPCGDRIGSLPLCASMAGPVAQAWNASSDSHWVTTK